jgi:hypothetical protein
VQVTRQVEPAVQVTLLLLPTVTSHEDMPLQSMLHDSPQLPRHVALEAHLSEQLPPHAAGVKSQAPPAGQTQLAAEHMGGGFP